MALPEVVSSAEWLKGLSQLALLELGGVGFLEGDQSAGSRTFWLNVQDVNF